MKDAGYELPTTGLCYNLSQEDSNALISEGEWLLAEDELVAREGKEQQFLYLIVSGSVELSKKDEKGKQQVIANLGSGETFGEVAFLRGHIASATSETRGLCILWRMNHDQLLEFIGQSWDDRRTTLPKLGWFVGRSFAKGKLGCFQGKDGS